MTGVQAVRKVCERYGVDGDGRTAVTAVVGGARGSGNDRPASSDAFAPRPNRT
ncbi:hypothetical protein [Streptomyces sp. NBC_01618]|uniref:hypothetical protein n=1 Tax=Streptomyces sp. NBC_01618 TaxID=2975900 RepID=UPI00386A8F41|nr:hypothetical protein OH735_33100 [Streptomyces sp. NBC_01618]